MCPVFKCHIQGVCKYITGSMVATMVSSYSLGKGYCIDWSSEDYLSRAYEGGFVMKPKRGFHKNVYILDIAAMYASIMIGANVSCETILPNSELIYIINRPCIINNSVWWDNQYLMSSFEGDYIVIDRENKGISSLILTDFTIKYQQY